MLQQSKPHYALLDGLRGVAALSVVCYHVFEGFATSPADQRFNHGYLAVDFFFILSGFVIGYAYDDRWRQMSAWQFLRRRLVRLHPMVIMGVALGVVAFAAQGCVRWDGTHVGALAVALAALFAVAMIPVAPSTLPEIRGNGEMYPLNGPCWSLFFEYIGNVAYAFVLRRLPTKVLAVLVALLGAGLASFAIFNVSGYHNIGMGWTFADMNFTGGLLRMLFSFSMGLLMTRLFRRLPVRGAFWLCGAIVVAVFAVPHLGGVANGVYDAVCVTLVFPVVVWLGASGVTTDARSSEICRFLGDISYPLYVVHYPSMYLYYAWVWREGLTFSQTWHAAALIVVGNVVLAWILLRFYDKPVRRWLGQKIL